MTATPTIKDAVANAVRTMAGSKDFTIKELPFFYHEKGEHQIEAIPELNEQGGNYLSAAQIAKALKAIPFVQYVAKGTYRVKGRRVPA